jgi:putative tryptophan/tyrosine transport system substrate-binding protein
VPRAPLTAIARFTVVVAAALGAASSPSQAQHDAKVYRIGVLETVPAASNVENLSAFRERLRELGYIEGQNIAIEYRSADGRTERLADLANELVRLNVDLIVTRGTPAAISAKHATATIPIVMASSGEPAAEGVVVSLARPGGNVTGFHMMVPAQLGRTRLKLLKEAVPGASRVGILWNPADMQTPLLVKDTQSVARAMRVELKSLELQAREGLATFDRAFETALMDQADAMIVVEDYVTVRFQTRILDFTAMSRLPAIYGLREFVDAGGLMSYGPDRRDLFRRSATYVDRIFKGAKPAEIQVEAPTKFELAINLKTAHALGLTIPSSLLQRADYLVQ